MEILYCARCGRVIPPGGVDEGKYYQVGDDQVCPKCYHQMPDEEHTGGTLLKAPPVERRFRPPTSKLMPAARQSAKRSSTRLPAVRVRASPAKYYVAAAVMAILIIGIIILIASSNALRRGTGAVPGMPPMIETPRTPPPPVAGGSGTILREVWRGVSGSNVGDLTHSPKFSGEPSAVAYPTSFQAPAKCGSNYGTRMRGYVHPPASGRYVFWLLSDDASELWLSSDESPANRTRIATVAKFSKPGEWEQYPTQKSAPRELQAGRRYYIEALHKQGIGDDYLAVGWQLPDGTRERPIPGSRLSPFALVGVPQPGGPTVGEGPQPTITAHPASAVASVGQRATFCATAAGAVPLTFQWRKNGAAIPDAAGPFYTTEPLALGDNGAKFSVVVSNRAGQAASREAVLTVCPEAFSVWFDDALPEGAVVAPDSEPWTWVAEPPAPRSGAKVHLSPAAAGTHQHYFSGATMRLTLDVGDRLFAWVYLDPADVPEQVMLQWNTGDQAWSHRAWWGADKISKAWNKPELKGPEYHRAGDLPAAGRWVRLEVPARDVGLEGRTVYGMAFALFGGKAAWDCAGKLSPPAPAALPGR